MKNRILIMTVGALGLFMATGASADYVWTFSGPASVSGPYNASGTGVTVTASAWRNKKGDNSTDYGKGKLETATLRRYSGGLGVSEVTSSPNHAVDNSVKIDSILLSFSQAVTLSQVQFGWVSGDSDFTLAAYTGDDGANNETNLTQLKYGNMAAHGWNMVGSYDGASSYPESYAVNNSVTPVSSSYWLVSALNPKLDSSTSLSRKNDFFKLKGVSARISSPQVPEPSMISLFLIGLLLAGYMSSQKRQRAAGRLAA